MTIVFSNFSSPKRSKLGILVPNLRIFVSTPNFVFQNCFPKYPNKACLVPNLRMLVFAQNFALDKLEGVDYKYDNSF